jgi:DNA (cytosine-5)-methyltransferase 1
VINKRDGASPAEDDAPSCPESEASQSYVTKRERPRLLELFSGAGGSAMGYARAGFEVVCVDLAPQPRCPFEFHQGDAIAYAKEHAHGFDVIAGGPPCKVHSALKHLADPSHTDLVPDTREVMIASGLPYAIENVPGAPLRDPVVLCGSMFDLGAGGRQLRRARTSATRSAPTAAARTAPRTRATPTRAQRPNGALRSASDG